MPKFEKGQSGNPGGRPKEVAEVRELARTYTPQALETLKEIMSDKNAPPAARVSAANAILDRAYGRPSQEVALNASGDVSLSTLLDEAMKKRSELEEIARSQNPLAL